MREQESPRANQGAKDLAEGSKSSLGQIQHYPEVRQWNWNSAERDAYEFGYLLGHADGATRARDEIRKLNHEADRLYAEMCRRPAPQFVDPNRKSYKELQAIRAEIYGGAA